jgi:hypothetical protein
MQNIREVNRKAFGINYEFNVQTCELRNQLVVASLKLKSPQSYFVSTSMYAVFSLYSQSSLMNFKNSQFSAS